MEKLLNNLHMILCSELEDATKKGLNTHNDIDLVKDLIESIKNIYEINNLTMEKTMPGEMDGYSMRGNSYAVGNGNSYAMRNGNSYAMRNSYAGGSSYAGRSSYAGPKRFDIYYEPEYSERSYGRYNRGYSGATKEEMIEELKEMKKEASSPEILDAISECITKMEK